MNVTIETSNDQKNGLSSSLAWTGMRLFRVTGLRDESENIRSIWLAPEGGEILPSYRAGQYIPVRVPRTGGGQAPMRTYSLSTAPGQTGSFKISVKREEGALNGTLPPGVFSNYLHDNIEIGTSLEVGAPRGEFVLDVAGTAPVCFISAGVGVTPIMSMLEKLVYSDDRRQITFIHGARNGNLQAFRDHARLLTKDRAWIDTHIRYSRPLRSDSALRAFDSVGRVDIQLALSMNLSDDTFFFLCGPLGFLRDHYQGLSRHGVPAERIHYENFGIGVDLAMESAKAITPKPPPVRRRRAETSTITFAQSGVVIEWDDSEESILDAAEAAGLSPMYSCRSGICQTCSCRLVEGAVEYFNDPTAPPEDGEVLICSSRPRGNVVLDL